MLSRRTSSSRSTARCACPRRRRPDGGADERQRRLRGPGSGRARRGGGLHCEEQDYHATHSYFLGRREARHAARPRGGARLPQVHAALPDPAGAFQGARRAARTRARRGDGRGDERATRQVPGPNLDSMAAVARRGAVARAVRAMPAKHGAQLRSGPLAHHLGYCTTASSRRTRAHHRAVLARRDRSRRGAHRLPVAKVEKSRADGPRQAARRLAQGEGQLVSAGSPAPAPARRRAGRGSRVATSSSVFRARGRADVRRARVPGRARTVERGGGGAPGVEDGE